MAPRRPRQWACSQRNKSRSETAFGPFPNLKAWFYPLWTQSSFKSGFWNAKKMAFWIVICLESLILRTCERKALLEHDSCVRILEMHAEAMHGSICAAGTNYYLPVRRSCLWSGQRLQCMWTHVVQITNPIRKRIAIQNGFRNVISSFVNRPNDSWSSSALLSMITSFLSFDYLSTYCCVYYVSITEALIIPISKKRL